MPAIKEAEPIINAQQKQMADSIVEAQIKILTVSYDKMSAYTNLIIVAGYASFFGLWSLTSKHLTKQYELSAAFLMVISVVTFVAFEVSKTYCSSKRSLSLNKIISDTKIRNSYSALQKAFADHDKHIAKHNLFWGYWWHFSWIITVATGFSGAGILLWAFIKGLYWP